MRQAAWNIASGTVDIVTALSVWTHLNEDDFVYYLSEVHRVLRPGGFAPISFFILDDDYYNSIATRHDIDAIPTTFHGKPLLFDVPCSPSGQWHTTAWATLPEEAIAVSRPHLEATIARNGLCTEKHYVGCWKDVPGLYHQDILVLRKRVNTG
jgi:hypothetical protein